MENTTRLTRSDQEQDLGVRHEQLPAAGTERTSSVKGSPATDRFAADYRKGLLTALTALSIFSGAPDAFADESGKPTAKNAPKIAKIEGSVDHQDKDHPAPNHAEHHDLDLELRHHVVKAGSILAIGKQPTSGFEATYSWMPSVNPDDKLHFILTPIDLMVTQHHLEIENHGHHESITRPKFFIGGLAGLAYIFNQYLELESSLGGGAAFIPYAGLNNGEAMGHHYQLTPVLKMDTQLNVIFDHTHHFGAYVGYAPEIALTPVPHAITPEGVQRKTHMEHILALGLRKDF
jgi:hypothetical protein